jgi:hypothetical protein
VKKYSDFEVVVLDENLDKKISSCEEFDLEDIEDFQKKNPSSSQWEKDLIDRIEKDTGMFETHEIAIIKSLQIQRHLSAHPVIKNSLELYHPNKETVRAFIRNILEFFTPSLWLLYLI